MAPLDLMGKVPAEDEQNAHPDELRGAIEKSLLRLRVRNRASIALCLQHGSGNGWALDRGIAPGVPLTNGIATDRGIANGIATNRGLANGIATNSSASGLAASVATGIGQSLGVATGISLHQIEIERKRLEIGVGEAGIVRDGRGIPYSGNERRKTTEVRGMLVVKGGVGPLPKVKQQSCKQNELGCAQSKMKRKRNVLPATPVVGVGVGSIHVRKEEMKALTKPIASQSFATM